MRLDRSGVVLLEVMVALAILVTAGLSLVAVAAESLGALKQSTVREAELREASRLLTAGALLSRRDLDLRLGDHAVGEFVMRVQRPEPALYRISVAATGHPDADLLATIVFRPATP